MHSLLWYMTSRNETINFFKIMKIPNRIGMRPLFMHSSIIFPLFDLIAVAFVWSSKELYRRAVERLHKRIWKMFQRNALNNIKFHTQLLSTSNTEKRRRCTEEMVIIILVFRKRHKKRHIMDIRRTIVISRGWWNLYTAFECVESQKN